MKKKVFNKNFFLLWQGQAVSALGDAVGDIALDFFVLKLTGSATIMGTVMALVTIPRVIIGPISGVVADRCSRKVIIVVGDIVRGCIMLLLGCLAHNEALEVWMIFLAALLSGLCASFFNPAVEAAMPELVGTDQLIKASSIQSVATTATQVIGQTLGGYLYEFIGAIALFFINGVTYILSAFSESFIVMKRKKTGKKHNTVWVDMKEGFQYVKTNKGLSRIILLSVLFNFLFGMIRVLLIPWFAGSESLGTIRYGFLNAGISIGTVIGMIVLSIFNIPEKRKYTFYFWGMIGFSSLIGISGLINRYIVILVGFSLAFMLQIVFNMILISTVMKTTPDEMRGKVSATRITLVMAASPLGNFVGGILGDIYSPNLLVVMNAVIAIVVVVLLARTNEVKLYINA